FVIEYRQHCVAVLTKFINTDLRLQCFLLSFPAEWNGNNSHGEDVHVLGNLGDYRCRTCAGASSHSRGDEHHLRSLEQFPDLVFAFERGGLADFRVRATTETFSKVGSDLKLARHRAQVKSLGVRIANHEFDILDALIEHVVYGVASPAAHADHLDDGARAMRSGDVELVGSCV